MKTFTIVLLVILVILIVACVVLYFVGKKAEKKQADQQAQLDAVAQTVSILVIDKGRMKLKDAGLPDIVLENTPKYLRRSKVPVVKAKVGPKIMTLISDNGFVTCIPCISPFPLTAFTQSHSDFSSSSFSVRYAPSSCTCATRFFFSKISIVLLTAVHARGFPP